MPGGGVGVDALSSVQDVYESVTTLTLFNSEPAY